MDYPYQPTPEFALKLDEHDPLKHYRDLFSIPKKKDGRPVVYFTGNSLGLKPKSVNAYILAELKKWEDFGVEGHFEEPRPWFHYHSYFTDKVGKLVGAYPHEVVVMNSLTVNLHLMLTSFYTPTPKRFKIITEAGAFPSDQYALESQVKLHHLHPDQAIIELSPRKGELTLRTEDIVASIQEHKNELALVMMGGVNYYTGQVFDMKTITKATHAVGALCGFDLAHATGNIELDLHSWGVDFAVWCTYKYLNSGPGGTSGVFVHERHANSPHLPRLAGWWGHDEATRFKMQKGFSPMHGAEGWQLSNAQILPMAAHLASLEIFDKVGMEALRKKSLLLTGFMEYLIGQINQGAGKELVRIITPATPADRGCQLSLVVKGGKKVFTKITKAGMVADWREPDVIRIAPVPLYNSFTDVYQFYEALREAL
jgi:kynureninase